MKKGTACRRCALARRRKEEAVFRFLCWKISGSRSSLLQIPTIC